MKALILAAALAAPADPMAGFYGNTIRIEVPAAFYVAVRHIDPDGGWSDPDRGQRGRWQIENGQVCSWQTEPAIQNPRRYCYAPVPRKVGDQWESTDPDTGNLVIQTLVAGRTR